MRLSLSHRQGTEGGFDKMDNHGDPIDVPQPIRTDIGGAGAVAQSAAPGSPINVRLRTSDQCVRPPFMPALQRIVAVGLRRLWVMLPPKWLPSAHTAIWLVAACLPRRPEARLRRFLTRLWAESGSMARDYAAWIRLFERTDAASRKAAEAHIGGFADPPRISILMPVFNPDPDHLRAAIRSVQAQFYPRWELCIADYSSGGSDIPALLAAARATEPRIRVVRKDPCGPIVPAAGAALGLAGGVFVTILHHDALLAPHALYEMASAIVTGTGADILYSDDDQIDQSGHRSNPYFKPDWNPELMLGQNLIGCLGLYRRDLVERAGGFRSGLDGAEEYDLALRMVAATEPDRIVHIPKVLYHWRAPGGHRPAAEPGRDVRADAGRRAVAEFLRHRASGGQGAAVASAPVWGRVIYPVPRPAPLVTVIVPTRDHADLLARTMSGLLDRTDYPNVRVLVADNGSVAPAALALLRRLARDSRVSVKRCPGPFNYAALNNAAVRQADGDLILLLNNDVDVIDPHWMREMVSHAIRPEIGAVGAKLLYPDGAIQHAGLTFGMSGVAGHPFSRQSCDDTGYFGHLKLARNVTAVTGACLMVRRQAYLEVGGLNETDLPVAFNDVDLCLKLIERGYRNLWTPHARLYHLESASRGCDRTPEKAARLRRETAYMLRRWGDMLGRDPYWNPNLSLDTTSVALAVPPCAIQAVSQPARDRLIEAAVPHRWPAFGYWRGFNMG